ncbi:hypothetical protein D3C79_871060 [compost metagenome]
MLQATPQHVVRHCAAALGGNAEPAPGHAGVRFDATPVEQDLPQQQLCLDRALPCRRQNRLGGLAGTVLEHGLQTGHIHHFLTSQQVGHGSDLGPAAQQVVVGTGQLQQ